MNKTMNSATGPKTTGERRPELAPDECQAQKEDLTMNVSREMPKYECHKKVWALKIAGIVGDQHGGVYFQPAEEGYDKVPMSPEYVAKHKPEVGGYYVVYEDGYKSFSPASAFESGYTPL